MVQNTKKTQKTKQKILLIPITPYNKSTNIIEVIVITWNKLLYKRFVPKKTPATKVIRSWTVNTKQHGSSTHT